MTRDELLKEVDRLIALHRNMWESASRAILALAGAEAVRVADQAGDRWEKDSEHAPQSLAQDKWLYDCMERAEACWELTIPLRKLFGVPKQ